MLGTLLLGASHFIREEHTVLMFGHILSTVSLVVTAFYCWMLILTNRARTTPVLLILLGSFGTMIGFLAQIGDNKVYDKPPIIHIGVFLLCIGIIMKLNTKLKRKENGGIRDKN